MGQRFSKSDYLNGKFYQLSKEIFKGKYKELSNNERVLYSILKDRFELSIKNEWVDQDNNIYFIFEQVQLSEECCMSLKTVQRAMQNLVEFELIDSVRQGQNLPNKLYLLKPEQEEVLVDSHNKEIALEDTTVIKDLNNYKELIEKGTSQNDLSEQAKKSFPDKSKSPTIYTNIIYTNNNYTSSSKDSTLQMAEEEALEEKSEMKIENKIIIKEILQQREEIPEEIIIKVYNVLNNFFKFYKSDSIKIQEDYISVTKIRRKIYCNLENSCFINIVRSIINSPNTIIQLQPYVINCFYNYSENSILQQKRYRVSEFNNFEQNKYDFAKLEEEILQN